MLSYEVDWCAFACLLQAMDELDLRDFTFGGVNITGFTLVDTSLSDAQTASSSTARVHVLNKPTVSADISLLSIC